MSIDTYVEEFDFGEFRAVLKRHWKPAALAFISLPALAVAYLAFKPPTYMAQGKILVGVDRKASLTGVAEEVGSIENLSSGENPVNSQIEILRSVVVIGNTIEELGLTNDEGLPLSHRAFRNQLETSLIAGTDVILVGYRSTDPELSARVVNSLMDMYFQNNAESNQTDVISAREFIETQLPRSEATVNEAETALRVFREQNNILNLQQESDVTSNRIASLEDQAATLRIQLSSANQQKELLRSQLGFSPERVLEVVDLASSPGIQQALANVQDLQSRLAAEQARFQANSPLVLGLQTELAQMQQLLDRRIAEQLPGRVASLDELQLSQLRSDLISQYVQIDLEVQSLASQIEALDATLLAARERASVLPELEQRHRELERQLSAAQGTYEQLLSRLREVQAAENQTVNNARIISPALVPSLAESKNAQLLIPAAGVVGGLLAIAVAFCFDLMDTSVKSTRDVNRLFNYRALANVPDLDRSQLDPLRLPLQFARSEDRSKLPAPFTPASAAFHALQTNLNFTKPDSAPQSIAVVSALSKEGKTTVAANLACIMAQNRFRTLLIDGDMFHPKQHEVWELGDDIGLSRVLEGEAKLMRAIQSVMPNLDILPIGERSKAPSPDYNKFRAMLAQLATIYDRIILDTPPLLMSADGGILAGMTDGAVMVARPGVLDVSSANMVKNYLDDSDISILGLVVNGQRDELDRYASYYR